MTTPTTAEQVNAVVREFGQGQMVDVLDIDNVRFIAKSTVQTLVHNMAQEILATRATIARLEARPEMLVIPASSGLDQVRVFFVDHEPGKGTLVISCYGEAWSCYFGAMGKRTLRQFVASVSRDYLGNAMRIGNAHYRERIANAVILACRDAVAAASGDTATTPAVCSECHGDGYITVAVCCGNGHNGECCYDPEPSQEPCPKCSTATAEG